MKYTSRADLLIAAGESIKMQEKAGITPVFKYGDRCWTTTDLILAGEISEIEFPLAVVEGKPVFVGDELYDSYGRLVKAEEYTDLLCCINKPALKTDGRWYAIDSYSWNQPKSKTVMVELLREDAESFTFCQQSPIQHRVAQACRKALDKA